MRTTIQIDDELFRAAKKLAAETGRTLASVIEDSLRAALAARNAAGTRRKIRLKTCGGKGVQPGVDLDDTASLLDLMESPGDSR